MEERAAYFVPECPQNVEDSISHFRFFPDSLSHYIRIMPSKSLSYTEDIPHNPVLKPWQHRNTSDNGLLVLIIIAIFSLVLIFIKFQRKTKKNIFHSTSYKEMIKKTKSLPASYFNLSYFLSLAFSFLIISVGTSFCIRYKLDFRTSIKLFIGLTGYHFSLILILKWIGWTFESENGIKTLYTFRIKFNIYMGFILAPLVILMFLLPPELNSVLIRIGIFLSIISLLYCYFWCVRLLFICRFSIFYIILYLCALEIAPILIIGKFLHKVFL